ncbi:MAG TPA: LUD domain-containing protein [Dehalococcoidia bacterium]|nr:LUD domain-containing protein [Dehalococcoidia bacterium]
MDDLITTFRLRAEAAQSQVVEVANWTDAIAFASSLTEDDLVLPAALAEQLAGDAGEAKEKFRSPDPNDPVRSVADAPVGLVRGEFAVAETGSVLLVEPSLIDRSVSMLCHTLVQTIPRDCIVASLDDCAAWLSEATADPASNTYATLSTGPSRTADIERSLTIGVQGPRELYVVIVG